jgi:hypothetical protein
MRTRLVLIDFILANPEAEYLETEQDKVTFFCEKLGVAKEFLSDRVYEGGPGSRPTFRYFVDKFPLFLGPLALGVPTVVTSSYVDSGLGTISGFLTHLAAYPSLFRQLQDFRFLYVVAHCRSRDSSNQKWKAGFPERLSATCFWSYRD